MTVPVTFKDSTSIGLSAEPFIVVSPLTTILLPEFPASFISPAFISAPSITISPSFSIAFPFLSTIIPELKYFPLNKVEISKSFNSSDVLSVIFILPVFLAVPPSFLIAILLLEFSIVPNPNAIVPLFVAVPPLIEIPIPPFVLSFSSIIPLFVKVVELPSTTTPIAFSPETKMLPFSVFIASFLAVIPSLFLSCTPIPFSPFTSTIPLFSKYPYISLNSFAPVSPSESTTPTPPYELTSIVPLLYPFVCS